MQSPGFALAVSLLVLGLTTSSANIFTDFRRHLLQGGATAANNYNPVTITVNSAPYDILSTPITPAAAYPQNAFQCNLTGDSRYPPYATGTYPETVFVPVGTRVRVIFANGNLNGATVTQQGEPGVIVQQGGAVIVQQVGGASPIVQSPASPVVQQNAPSNAFVVQQSPTVVQQTPSYPQSPVVQQPPSPTPVTPTPPVTPSPTNTPAPTTKPPTTTPAPTTPAPTTKPPTTTPAPTTPAPTTKPPTTTPAPTTPAPTTKPPTTTPAPTTPAPTTKPPTTTPAPTTPAPTEKPTDKPTPAPTTPAPTTKPTDKPDTDNTDNTDNTNNDTSNNDNTGNTGNTQPTNTESSGGRKLLQDSGLVPGGPNNGLVEYVALGSANTVPGFVVPNTQFGVPYVEFTASEAARGQVATFSGSLVVAKVVGGVPLYPFQVNPNLSPFCQVNVKFAVA